MVVTKVELTANLEENSAALMTSDRGNGGEAELSLTTPVTPKTAGLNPNATVFLCNKPSDTVTIPDNTHWDGVNANSDYQNANGDLSSSEQGGDITPPLESPLPSNEVTGYLDNQPPAGEVTENNVNDEELVPGNISEEQLRQLLKQQLEVCFSRENLASDSYLQSQMDADQYVPIATVANLQQIQQLTNNLELIVELLRESASVQVDSNGEKVRPSHNRCIVILREIPDTTPPEDVKELFEGENCPKFVSCEFAHNDSWYVTFDSDISAQRAYQYLREEVCTFLGKPIMARIKAKPLIRMTYPRNGYRSQYHQQQVQAQQAQQQQTSQTVVTSPGAQQQSAGEGSNSQQQYSVQQQVPTMMQPYINGNQPIPFFTPNPILPSWATTSPTLLDPSMVLAINGYQATSVKMNPTPPRHSFSNVNRNRNQRPPRSNNQDHRLNNDNRQSHDRQGSVGGMDRNSGMERDRGMGGGSHRTSPRNSEPSHSQISHHSSPYHSQRNRGDNSVNHQHMVHSTVQPPVMDNNSNITVNNRQTDSLSQRPKSYRSRRRRDDDANRSTRPGGPTPVTTKDNRAMNEPQFDLEINSFPPLPGPGTANSSTAGDIFESKLSDVVKGTAKPQVRELVKTQVTPPPVPPPPPSSGTTSSPISPPPIVASSTMTTASAPSTARPTTPPVSKEKEEKSSNSQTAVSAVPSSGNVNSSAVTTTSRLSAATVTSRVNNTTATTAPRAPSPPITPQKSSKSTTESVPKQNENPSTPKPVTNSVPKTVEKQAVVSTSVKLTYAQMLQRGRENEAAASAAANEVKSGSDDEEIQQNGPSRLNQTLKEQSQTQKPSTANSRVPGKDQGRRDFESKDQRFGSGRRAKENRERRDRHRSDRREREGSRSSTK